MNELFIQEILWQETLKLSIKKKETSVDWSLKNWKPNGFSENSNFIASPPLLILTEQLSNSVERSLVLRLDSEKIDKEILHPSEIYVSMPAAGNKLDISHELELISLENEVHRHFDQHRQCSGR